MLVQGSLGRELRPAGRAPEQTLVHVAQAMVFKLINISKGKRADIAVKALSVFWLAVVMDEVLSEVMDEGEIIVAHGADTVFLA